MLLFYGMLVIVALELMYRYQLVDTYQPELVGFNDPSDLEEVSGRPTILVMGDSFTAGSSHYANRMNRLLPSHRVINSGVGGSGIIQASYMAPGRFDRFEPDIFIYQVYIGNDLLDISYPVNWSELSVIRNIYWTVAQDLRSIGYLNFRMGNVFQGLKFASVETGSRTENGHHEEQTDTDVTDVTDVTDQLIDTSDTFSPKRYTLRTKVYFKAEPELIENTVRLMGGRERDFVILLEKLGPLLDRCVSEQCRAYVVVIPHVCQVNQRYLNDMIRLGAHFRDPEAMQAVDYPFITAIDEFLNRTGRERVQLINPLEELSRHETNGNHVYFQNDPHLNAYGQQVLAEFLIGELDLVKD